MFEYIKGKLIDLTPTRAVVDVGGIGYQLLVPLSSYSKIHGKKEVCFFVSFVVREDSQRLFGFLEREERDLFEKLSDVSGIGPKTALALIGHLSSDDLQMAILNGNAALLSKVPGIGKKTAERLIVELRDRLKKLGISSKGKKVIAAQSGIEQDAISALVNLGYPMNRAENATQKALGKLKDCKDLSLLIREALKSV